MRAALRVTEPPINVDAINPGGEHRALISRIATSRDREAFAELFAYFGPRIKAIMMKGGADAALAEDLAQDVMMTVWRKVNLYAPERGTVSTWIFTIARNARIDRLRKGSSQPYEDIDDMELVSDAPNAEDETLAGQQAVRVRSALDELPNEQREVIELAYLHDVSQSEIASRLSLPLGTVKSRLRLAYAKLRTELKDVQ